MGITTLLKETWKDDNIELRKSISLLKKEVADYKDERKSNWKLFKTKYRGDLNKLEQSLKTAKAKRKEQEQPLSTKPVYQIPTK
jgi:predicted metal-dependent hydrolase